MALRCFTAYGIRATVLDGINGLECNILLPPLVQNKVYTLYPLPFLVLFFDLSL